MASYEVGGKYAIVTGAGSGKSEIFSFKHIAGAFAPPQ